VDEPTRITPLLERVHAGDRNAMDEVARHVHADLVRLAARILVRKRGKPLASVTLDPHALVNETFIRLLQQRKQWANRKHFFAIATRIMLRVLADYHRAQRRGKRKGVRIQISLGALEREASAKPPAVEIPLLTLLLEQLDDLDPRVARVAKLRLLWGLEIEDVAKLLGVSRSTIDREWRFARAWLASRL
jgi:RNA polymerase sigma factor (TIGR02999 family)